MIDDDGDDIDEVNDDEGRVTLLANLLDRVFFLLESFAQNAYI